MARKKPARKKRGKKRPLLWFILGLLLLCSIAATLYLVFLRPGTIPSPPTAAIHKKRPAEPPAKPGVPPPPVIPAPAKIVPQEPRLPLVSIIIDDMGFQDAICTDLLALDLNLSFAFLPYGPHTETQLALARRKNRDILLHLPMQPRDSKWLPGPGALLTSMGPREIQSTLAGDLAAVPQAIGVNNHMGSLFTEHRTVMLACLTLLKENNLFFLDSLTSPKSVGFAMAKELGLKSAQRDVFIDNNQDPQHIREQLDTLISLARRQGSAIGIGHPHQATLVALRSYEAKLQKEIQLVGVSRLAK